MFKVRSLIIVLAMFLSSVSYAQEKKQTHPLIQLIETEAFEKLATDYLSNNDVPYLILQKLKDKEFRERFINLTFEMDIALVKNAEQYYQDKIDGKSSAFRSTTRITGSAFQLIEYTGAGGSYRAYEYLKLPHLAFSSTAYMSDSEFDIFLRSLKSRYAAIDLAIEELNSTKKRFAQTRSDLSEEMWSSEKVDSSFLKHNVMLPPVWFFRFFKSTAVQFENMNPATVEEIKVATARYFDIISYLVEHDLLTELFKEAFVNEINASRQLIVDIENRFQIFSDSRVEKASHTLYQKLNSEGYTVDTSISNLGGNCGTLF